MFIEKVVFKNIHKNLQGDYQFSYDFQWFQLFIIMQIEKERVEKVV